jgi:hypothetical protein
LKKGRTFKKNIRCKEFKSYSHPLWKTSWGEGEGEGEYLFEKITGSINFFKTHHHYQKTNTT